MEKTINVCNLCDRQIDGETHLAEEGSIGGYYWWNSNRMFLFDDRPIVDVCENCMYILGVAQSLGITESIHALQKKFMEERGI